MLYFWIFFNAFAVIMLVLDLKVFHRAGRVVRPAEALAWSGLWIALALGFAAIVYIWQGKLVAIDFVAGYVLELSLSVDNLFIFLLVFRYFAVPEGQQHRVLFWGILGAMLMRGIFIVAGVGLLQRFHWILYLFGLLLIYSGVRLLRSGGHQVNPAKNPLVKTLRRWMPVTDKYEGGKFLVRGADGGFCATPLLLVLIVIETSDLLFAVDSIPAVLAITLNTFIVYTSNIFAIMGLRSMYFALSGLMKMFRYLHYGLTLILVMVGAKMLAADYYRISTLWTLAVLAAILVVSVAASVMNPADVSAQI